MPRLIEKPTKIDCVGTKPKQIQEFAGHVNSGHKAVSVARMISPGGWEEPGQRPEFEEITLVLKGMLRVEHTGGALDVHAGQARCACRRFRRTQYTAIHNSQLRNSQLPRLGSWELGFGNCDGYC